MYLEEKWSYINRGMTQRQHPNVWSVQYFLNVCMRVCFIEKPTKVQA